MDIKYDDAQDADECAEIEGQIQVLIEKYEQRIADARHLVKLSKDRHQNPSWWRRPALVTIRRFLEAPWL